MSAIFSWHGLMTASSRPSIASKPLANQATTTVSAIALHSSISRARMLEFKGRWKNTPWSQERSSRETRWLGTSRRFKTSSEVRRGRTIVWMKVFLYLVLRLEYPERYQILLPFRHRSSRFPLSPWYPKQIFLFLVRVVRKTSYLLQF
jgi:hypothetical protein